MRILLVNTSLLSSIGIRKVISTVIDKKVDSISKVEYLEPKLLEGRYSHVIINEQPVSEISRAIIQNVSRNYRMTQFLVIGKEREQLKDLLEQPSSNVSFLEENASYTQFQREIKVFLGIEDDTTIAPRAEVVLSNGQNKVYEYLISGYRTKQIAESLNIKQNTVSTVKKVIFKKLNAKSVVDLLEYSRTF
jgi:DNA-binding CsgD family transcriptional regulator